MSSDIASSRKNHSPPTLFLASDSILSYTESSRQPAPSPQYDMPPRPPPPQHVTPPLNFPQMPSKIAPSPQKNLPHASPSFPLTPNALPTGSCPTNPHANMPPNSHSHNASYHALPTTSPQHAPHTYPKQVFLSLPPPPPPTIPRLRHIFCRSLSSRESPPRPPSPPPQETSGWKQFLFMEFLSLEPETRFEDQVCCKDILLHFPLFRNIVFLLVKINVFCYKSLATDVFLDSYL